VTLIVAWLITQPIIREFLIELFMRLFAELITGTQADPVFRDKFFHLTSQLASAETEEEKRRVLNQIKTLRSGK
jgi:hypothetical protein